VSQYQFTHVDDVWRGRFHGRHPARSGSNLLQLCAVSNTEYMIECTLTRIYRPTSPK
jgi:hypothetical protein